MMLQNDFLTSIKNLLWKFRLIFDYSALHPVREMQKLALQETVKYIQQNMMPAAGLITAKQTLSFAVGQTNVDGYYLEFGVWKGGSIRWIAHQIGEKMVHGFDSFEGLPSNWGGHKFYTRAFYDLHGRLPKVPKNVELHPGLFKDTLPSWLEKHPGAVAFIHIDCDLYESTKDVFDQLAERIVANTIIAFDEYFNYPNWQQHEFKAFQEFVKTWNVKYEYLAYSRHQVVIKIVSKNSREK